MVKFKTHKMFQGFIPFVRGHEVNRGAISLTWMEYMMILKQRTAKVFPSHREWLSKCLWEHRQKEERDREDTEDVIIPRQW